jgi:hypothetical protein
MFCDIKPLMITYSPEIHTPATLEAEMERLHNLYPKALVVGSLGRAAAFKNIGYSPNIEFDERSQNPLSRGAAARDIDLITGQTDSVVELPFEVDAEVFDNRYVRIAEQAGDWFLISDRKNFFEPLHPAVMDPVDAETIHGIKCQTVAIKTHLALFGLKGQMGPKTTHSHELTMRAASLREEDLENELYKPFKQLRVLNQQGVYPFLQKHYRALLPDNVRHFLGPITRPLKSLLP